MQAPPVAPVTEIRPDDGFRRLVRIGSAVATALAVALGGALVAVGGPPIGAGALAGLALTPPSSGR